MVVSGLCRHMQLSLDSVLEHIHHAPKKPSIHQQSPLILPTHSSSLRQPLIWWFLSLQTCQFQVFHINGITQSVVLCDWLLLLSMFSRFIHVIASTQHFFKMPNNTPLYVYTFILFDEHLGCFHFLAIMNNASMNIHVQLLVWIYIFISVCYIPRNRIARARGNPVFKLLSARLFSKVWTVYLFPPAVYKDPISPSTCQHLLLTFFPWPCHMACGIFFFFSSLTKG